MPITLTRDLELLINERVKSGAYESPDEVIRASLRLLKARDDGMDALRKEILIGFENIQQGRFISCDSDQELDCFSDAIISRAADKLIPKIHES